MIASEKSNSGTESIETVRSGGFQIELRPDSIRVFKDPSAVAAGQKSILRKVLDVTFGLLVCGFLIAEISGRGRSISSLIMLAFLTVLLTPFFRSFRTVNNIYATRDVFQVIRVTARRVNGTWTFPRNQMSPIRFQTPSRSAPGANYGLTFTVESQKVHVLSGLTAPEARQILIHLQGLGYEAPCDISMPAAAEVELARGKSISGWN